MDGRYPPQGPPLGSFYSSNGLPMPDNIVQPNPLTVYPQEVYQPRLQQLQTMSTDSLGNYYSDYDDANRNMGPPQGQMRQRRRQPQGSEHVKHRRTRSGCYTCRNRRVKCDEKHPTCDRCRKGKRECAYPGTPSSTSSNKTSRSGEKSRDHESGSSASGDEFDDEGHDLLAPILDDEEEEGANQGPSQSSTLEARKRSDTSSSRPRSPARNSRRGAPRHPSHRSSAKHASRSSISQSIRWPGLSGDVQYYLNFHREKLSHYHYAMKYDGGNFLKTTFLEIAMNDDSAALLYAVVAFAAYHDTLTKDGDKISTFLGYYNKSIQLLQQSLIRKKHSVATLLTILQLATIEEFLGDWVNLMGHQRAAHQILTDLFTPQTIMQDETRRKIINWYMRFDLFASMMSGGETVLSREWFVAQSSYHTEQAASRPDDIGFKFEEYFSTQRLLATDVTLLFAAKMKGSMDNEEWVRQADLLMQKVETFGRQIRTAYTEPSCFVQDFSGTRPPRPDDLTDYVEPGFLFGGELFTMNFVMIDFMAIEMMFKHQISRARQQPFPTDLVEVALRSCKIFEAVEHYSLAPSGAITGCQASLGVASLFLPSDKKHTDWCRRKFALIEQRGYIYPSTLRKRMSDLWGQDVTGWWLPNDEGYPRIIRAIRAFIEFRVRVPPDAIGMDIRDMSGIFKQLNIAPLETKMPDDPRQGQMTTDDESSYDVIDTSVDPSASWDSSPDHDWQYTGHEL